MVRHLKAAEDQGRLISKLTSYLRVSVLVVDEVGYQSLKLIEVVLGWSPGVRRRLDHPDLEQDLR